MTQTTAEIVGHGFLPWKPPHALGNHFPNGKWLSDFPSWHCLLACLASRNPTIRKATSGHLTEGSLRLPLLCGYPSWLGVWRLSKQEIPPWKMILQHWESSLPTFSTFNVQNQNTNLALQNRPPKTRYQAYSPGSLLSLCLPLFCIHPCLYAMTHICNMQYIIHHT